MNVFYPMSFEIAPIIAQICAAHILLNIHDVMHVSTSDPNYGQNLDARSATYRRQEHTGTSPYDPHGLSFQMGSLPLRQPNVPLDFLDFDLDSADTQSIADIAMSSPKKLGLTFAEA